MSTPSDFLTAMGRALATMMLYAEGHRARIAAVEAAYDALHRLQSADPRPLFSFLGDEVVYGEEPLRELRDWEWGPRLAAPGVQRVEFDSGGGHEELDELLDELLAPLSAGWYAPEWIIRSRAEERQNKIRLSLADTLDLMSITVEAGLDDDGLYTHGVTIGDFDGSEATLTDVCAATRR
jgi:hypothetical protein